MRIFGNDTPEYVDSEDEDAENTNITINAPSNGDFSQGLLNALPTDWGSVLKSFMKIVGPEVWRGIAKLKNVDNVALGDDQTTMASRAITIAKNGENGIDDGEWDDKLFEDRDLIGIEFDKKC